MLFCVWVQWLESMNINSCMFVTGVPILLEELTIKDISLTLPLGERASLMSEVCGLLCVHKRQRNTYLRTERKDTWRSCSTAWYLMDHNFCLLMICLTAIPLCTIVKNTHCCSLTVRQEWDLERKKEGKGQDFRARYINMSEFTCTKRSNEKVFCYFCLKAGGWWEQGSGRQGRINSFTVQYLVSITSPKGEKQADNCYAKKEREIYGYDLLSMCTSGDIKGLNRQERVRIEATSSHSGCVLSSGEVTLLNEGKCCGSDSD